MTTAKQRLAARLRRAKHGSRDLDADVFEALGWRVKRAPETPRGVGWRYFKDSRWCACCPGGGDPGER